jgi:hypothetical protein
MFNNVECIICGLYLMYIIIIFRYLQLFYISSSPVTLISKNIFSCSKGEHGMRKMSALTTYYEIAKHENMGRYNN